ncbi:unnamed protein product [Paramecium pentaurelia]|uniref:Transmembrane protein n=1 Tax=Paramecium pentaurelia TaxID=43138 RepID=A0A8S1U2C4_9CILI|nr:unnamed protein product [Paramecium pentaurelia]
MNNGLRYISENRSQDLVYCFPLVNQKTPFQKNSYLLLIFQSRLGEQLINNKVFFYSKSTWCNRLSIRNYIYDIKDLRSEFNAIRIFIQRENPINLKSFIFFWLYFISCDNFNIHLSTKIQGSKFVNNKRLQTNIKQVQYYRLYSLFHLLFQLLLQAIFFPFIQKMDLKKQDYQPSKYSIYSIILNCIFSFISILYFIDIWWNLLICGISIMLFELLIIHSAKMILEELNLNLNEKDYIIAVPIIFCLSIVLFLALILLIIIVALLFCKSNNSEGQDDDEDDGES